MPVGWKSAIQAFWLMLLEKNMDLKSWYKERGYRFIWQRGSQLLNRYGLRSHKGTQRIIALVETLVNMGCAPTFFTPGIIVKRYPQFIRQLQQMGAEIAVHSYQHVNLSHLSTDEAMSQINRALQTFEQLGIENRGFRCPYLDYKDELLQSLPVGLFDYSSNEAIFWPVIYQDRLDRNELFYTVLEKFYQGKDSSRTLALPSTRFNLVEIPVSVPDDLQLKEGLQLNDKSITQVWMNFLDQTYKRGELFTLLFHTELASIYRNPFIDLFTYAKKHQPAVWIARLRDISDWWREKSKFKVECTSIPGGLRLKFLCSPRATVLVKGLAVTGSALRWDDVYHRVQTNSLEIQSSIRPFIGIMDGVPSRVISFLLEQGYILDSSDTARQCGMILDSDLLTRLPSEIELIDYIEMSPNPLVRYWRWPDGAQSAMSITGDLDAISLVDYASRLFVS